MLRPSLCIVALAALCAAPAAHAATLQQIVIDSFSGIADTVSFASFDPALGTLEKVQVQINGSLALQGPSQLNLVSGPGGPAPLPIGVIASATQNFSPIGIGGRGFEFSTPARFAFNITATGNGEQVIFSTPFSYDFTFDAIFDLVGFVIPDFSGATIPPVSVIGTRDDFLDLAPPLDGEPIQILVQTQIENLTGFAFANLTVGGSVQVTYTYKTPVVDVAEPTALALFGLGTLGLCWRRRR